MTLSIIVPICNAERFLENCLSSIAAQTLTDMEVILIDDGSTDGSGAVCDRYAADDPRFRAVHQSNQGVSAARNAGLALARGEWVLFADADDALWEDAAEKLRFSEYRGSDLVFLGYACARDDNPETLELPDCEEGLLEREAPRLLRRAMLNGAAFRRDRRIPRGLCLGVVWAKLYRREFLREHGLRFESSLHFAEDYLFNFQVFGCAPVCRAERLCAYWHRIEQGGGSVSQRYDPSTVSALQYVAGAVSRQLEEEGEDGPAADLEQAYLNWFRQCCRHAFFHEKNPAPLREKRAAFLALRDAPGFSAAFRHARPCDRSLKARVFFLLCRARCFSLVSLGWALLQRKAKRP